MLGIRNTRQPQLDNTEKGDTVAAMFLSELAIPYKPVVV